MTPMLPSFGFIEGVAQPLEKRFEVIKDVGDGSFGSVVLARVRGTRNMVAIKSMKKSFDSFSECLRLREVQSLRAIPRHPHIVPVLDAFLDPITHKLHLVMELMEINLYQFLKSRENKPFEPRTVQVILYQCCSALQHIHAHGFFHRDIKPENVLISVQNPPQNKSSPSQQRLYTPPQTPPSKYTPSSYIVKLADFGLAREIRSRPPYTSYVSTRWYRAPEVLLRAEEYSAPVDIWAMGAMAIEVATLRPIFPGTNEIDQLWRVCEVMGTPSEWWVTEDRTGRKVKIGGGPWNAGLKLADALSFKFPKVPPMDMTTILTAPWPKSLSEFVVSCLSWDPKRRPNSTQCINHEYFRDVERYLPIREPIPTPPATMHSSTPSQNGLKGLGIEVPQPPRGARPQASYTSLQPSHSYVQQELSHQQSQPQLQQPSKGGWFRRDKKRDSSITQLPSQAPQLPQINLAPAAPAVAPKIVSPGLNGGMAFSPTKQARPPPERPERPPERLIYPKEAYAQIPASLIPAQQGNQGMAGQAGRVSWTQQIQVPGQQPKPQELSSLALPTIRPVSPLQGDVFGESTFLVNRKPVKETVGLESPKQERSPVRQPIVNTFLQQAQQLEQAEPESNKVGRQLSAASRVPTGPDKLSSPTGSPSDDSNSPKSSFFSHFRKRARKRMSTGGDELSPGDETSSMPISPIPQLRPLPLGSGDKSLRNSIVMEDFFEDAREDMESDLLKQVDEALSSTYRPQHITIAPSPMKPISSHPPSSHKNGASPPIIIPLPQQKHNRFIPSPYPTNILESPPVLPPLTIPKRGSSRKLSSEASSDYPRSRRQNATPSPLPRIQDDIVPTYTTIPGAYPLSSSPDPVSSLDPSSIPMSRSTTNLSVTLPGAYPKDPRGRYNSSSSGLSSAASYRTAFEPETWETEEAKQKEEQAALQQSLMDATRAMRALEKYTFTDWTERPRRTDTEIRDTVEETPQRDSPWPTPPYNEESAQKGKNARSQQRPMGNHSTNNEMDYFRIGIPSPSDRQHR